MDNQSPSQPGTFRIVVALILSVVLAYWPRPWGYFVQLDTDFYVLMNPNVSTGLSLENIWWAWSRFYQANWHPLTWISHQLDVTLFGLEPRGHIMHNLLLHLANTLLVFFVFRKMTRLALPAAMVALVFAVHPLNVESVAWIAQRKTLLSTFFGLWCMWYYTDYAVTGKRAPFLASLLCFLLGLCAKPMLVTWPFVLLLFDLWPFNRLEASGFFTRDRAQRVAWLKTVYRLVLEKWPFFVATIAACWITVLAQGGEGAIASTRQLPVPNRFANAVIAYLVYLRDLVIPGDLGILYPHTFQMPPLWKAFACALLLLILTLLVLQQLARRPLLFTGWFLYVGTLVPVIGIVQVGEMTHADRYVYIPYWGLCICLFYGLSQLDSQAVKRTLAGLFIVWIGFLIYKTHIQNTYWDDTPILYEHTLEITGPNPIIENNLGAVYYLRGQLDEAEEHLRKAIEIRPSHRLARRNLGLVLSQKGAYEEALEQFRTVLLVEPEAPHLYVDAGKTLALMGQTEDAQKTFRKAIELDPKKSSGYLNLARTYDDAAQSISLLESALEHLPDNAEIHRELAINLRSKGRYEEAVKHFLTAIEIDPKLPKTHYLVALLYRKLNNSGAAITHFQKELEHNPTHLSANFNLAQYFQGRGDHARARPYLEQVIKKRKHHAGANFLLAQTLVMEEDYEGAAKLLRNGLKSKADHGKTWFLLGSIQEKLGNLEEALGSYRKAVSHSPRWVQGHATLVALLLQMGKTAEVDVHFEEALKLNGEHAELQNIAARFWLKEKPERALPAARKAYELNASSPEIVLTLALALEATGDIDRARRAAAGVVKLGKSKPLNQEDRALLDALNQRLEGQ